LSPQKIWSAVQFVWSIKGGQLKVIDTALFIWLVSQPANNVFRSHQISTGHQPASSIFFSQQISTSYLFTHLIICIATYQPAQQINK